MVKPPTKPWEPEPYEPSPLITKPLEQIIQEIREIPIPQVLTTFYAEPPGGRIPPTTPEYEKVLEEKYAPELKEIRAYKQKVRKVIGLKEYEPHN